ncbi:PQQ-dependent sugar dehydrogenase [Marinomonas mediterranea]|uniref:PQQ-dependent sugar dehydrogenase n=1 Tax=Marinomonas mediterranea TaxID=119864 RepID=UPI002349FD74|nr:PQQ-dependent sugar dehydrogenase [Marinomonas mediterranea]WCN09098.1 PQQ-dependent sugar dehydrogenase [Marinomonas mediterranea]
MTFFTVKNRSNILSKFEYRNVARRMVLKTTLLPLCFLFSACSACAPQQNPFSPNQSITVTELARFNDIPWGADFLDSDTLLVTLKSGKLATINLETGKIHYIEGLPGVVNVGQGGLLDVAVLDTTAPDHQTKEAPPFWIYFTYSATASNSLTTALGRAKLDKDRLVEWETLFIADTHSDATVHFGSRIAFDDNKHLYISIGDRGARDSAQDRSNHAGSIIRLNLDGSVPKDNPFYNDLNARAEIWSYGHRNPQGLFFDKRTQTLWSNEHGPRGGDEINKILKGENYGWPVVSYGKEYWSFSAVGEGTQKKGMEDAKKVFIPSIAPSDLLIYHGRLFSDWNDDIISTALALRHINRLRLNENDDEAQQEQRYLRNLDERFRSITQAPDSSLIVTTDSGKVLRLTP